MRRDLIRRAAESVLPPMEIDRPATVSVGNIKKKRSQNPESRTTIIAFRYRDGLVCVADRKVSVGYGIMSEEFRKINQVSLNSVLLGCGSVGSGQEMEDHLKSRCTSFYNAHGVPISIHGQARALARWCNWYRAVDWDFSFGGILAGSNADERTHIFAVDDGGSYIESRHFYADGSGGDGATIYLDVAWKPDLSFDRAVRLAVEAVYHSAKRDSGSSPLSVAVPTIALVFNAGGVMFVPEDDVAGLSLNILMEKVGRDVSASPLSIIAPAPGPARRRRSRRKK